MKVKEALILLNIAIVNEQVWRRSLTGESGYRDTGRVVINTQYGVSYKGDRDLLQSNFDSDIEYMDHLGPMGVIGFKMRNNQRALYLFNLLGHADTIIRVRDIKMLNRYKEAKEIFSNTKNYDLPSDEFDSWVTLKTIGGKRL